MRSEIGGRRADNVFNHAYPLYHQPLIARIADSDDRIQTFGNRIGERIRESCR